MRAIDAALAHMRELGTRSLEVPEWKGEDGAPLLVYWTPLTLAEREAIYAGGDLKLTSYADILFRKALDKNGEKLFTLEDKPKLRQLVESGVIQRIAMKILETPKLEDVEKN